MANQNGFGVLEIIFLVCMLGGAAALSYRYLPSASKEKELNRNRERELLISTIRDQKDIISGLEKEIIRLDTKTDNQRVAWEKALAVATADIKAIKDTLARLEVEDGKMGQRVSQIAKLHHTTAQALPKIIDVRVAQLEKPLEVKILSTMQKTYTQSVERWKRRSYGWEKEIVTKTRPYKQKKGKVSPEQRKNIQEKVKETKTAMQESQL